VTFVILQAGRGHADTATADRLAAEAEQLATRGDNVGAAAKFREAFAADPRPALICNVGVAYSRANELPRAHLFLVRCLERAAVLEPDFVSKIRAAVVDLERKLRAGDFTPVDVVVDPPSATVAVSGYAPDEAFVGSRMLWLPYGHHSLAISAAGRTTQTIPVDVSSRAVMPIRVALEPVVTPEVPVITRHPPPPPPEPAPVVVHRSRLPAIGATTITAVAAGVAVLSYRFARSNADKAEFALSDDAFAEAERSVDRWNLAFGISTGVAVLGAAASAYLWVRARRARVTATSSTAMVSVAF